MTGQSQPLTFTIWLMKKVFWEGLASSILGLAALTTHALVIQDADSRLQVTKINWALPSNGGTALGQSEADLASENERRKRELVIAQKQQRLSARQAEKYKEQLGVCAAQESELTLRIEEGNAQLLSKESAASAELNQLRQQIERLIAETAAIRKAAATDKADLQAKIDTLTADAAERHRLSSAISTCGVTTARELHMVSIYEAGPDGEHPTFGRFFFAPGKCLTFFIYDLPGKKQDPKLSFYLWGSDDIDKRPKNLGAFHIDDPADNRWVLTLDDPEAFSQINNLFVSIEPADTIVTRPSGTKLLTSTFRFLPPHKKLVHYQK